MMNEEDVFNFLISFPEIDMNKAYVLGERGLFLILLIEAQGILGYTEGHDPMVGAVHEFTLDE